MHNRRERGQTARFGSFRYFVGKFQVRPQFFFWGSNNTSRRFRPRRRNTTARALCCICLCLWCATSTCSSPFGRTIPRLVREVHRNLVDWDAKLVDARSRPSYNAVLTALHVYVISLERTPARRTDLLQELSHAGIAHETFFAVDGLLALEEEAILKYAGSRKRSRLISFENLGTHPRSSSHVKQIIHERLRFGCYLSHVRVWERLVNLNLPLAILLEDDVSIVKDFNSSLLRLIQKLPNDWDIFYLNSCYSKFGGLLRPGIRQVKGALCTHGYAISCAGAHKLLRKTALHSEKPVDHMLDEAIYSSLLSAYHAFPPLVEPQTLKSTLSYPA
mgnify:CR=1 FL=1